MAEVVECVINWTFPLENRVCVPLNIYGKYFNLYTSHHAYYIFHKPISCDNMAPGAYQ